jgi:hypothetical protein
MFRTISFAPKTKKPLSPFREAARWKLVVALISLLAYLAAHKLRRSASPAIIGEGAARKVEAKVIMHCALHGLFRVQQ